MKKARHKNDSPRIDGNTAHTCAPWRDTKILVKTHADVR